MTILDPLSHLLYTMAHACRIIIKYHSIGILFSPVKHFACKLFALSKFRHQTLATKIGIGRCTLHKYFTFRRKRSSTKTFNGENFAIYGTILRSISPMSGVPGVADVQPSWMGTTPVVAMVMTHKCHTHIGVGFQSLQQTYNTQQR